MRVVRAKLDFLLANAKRVPKIPFPIDGSEDERTSWYVERRLAIEFDQLLDTREWNDLPSLAESAPISFLQFLWPWFEALMFVGVAGSLKEDIPIGSVVAGEYVYNAHSAKVQDSTIAARPRSHPAAPELLAAAQILIYTGTWTDLIKPPVGFPLPVSADYPCDFPPTAVIKSIASGEEVLASASSARNKWLRDHLNDAGAVEMEGWGVVNAAHLENTPAIIIRGISDMCAGKDHAQDKLHQPIAAAHAAAFAFSILSFRSKAPV